MNITETTPEVQRTYTLEVTEEEFKAIRSAVIESYLHSERRVAYLALYTLFSSMPNTPGVPA